MSIPGLGVATVKQQSTTSTRRLILPPLSEWRFSVPHTNTLTVRLLAGTAERDGTELAPQLTYRLSGLHSRLLTWRGCEVEVEGQTTSESIASAPPPGSAGPDFTGGPVAGAVACLNLHHLLEAQRDAAAAAAAGRDARAHVPGPRVMVVGDDATGKTTATKTLAALAVRSGREVMVVNTNPKEGMLVLPGTLSAAVFSTIMGVENEGGGWGGPPSSGPSATPVKLPLGFYYGMERVGEDGEEYRRLVGQLAEAVESRMQADDKVSATGMLVDTPGIIGAEDGKGELTSLLRSVEALAINIVVVLGSTELATDLTRRFGSSKTAHGKPINVVRLERLNGAIERDAAFMQYAQEAAIREYFFGDAKRTLSPFTQMVDFDAISIFKRPDAVDGGHNTELLEKVEPSPALSHWTLTVMSASITDSPAVIRAATVLGYVCVADVDRDRRRIKLLSPMSGSLGHRPMIWGKWPEQFINLLG